MASNPNPWEKIYSAANDGHSTYRLVVPGGWLYMVRSFVGPAHAVSLQFVPKPNPLTPKGIQNG